MAFGVNLSPTAAFTAGAVIVAADMFSMSTGRPYAAHSPNRPFLSTVTNGTEKQEADAKLNTAIHQAAVASNMSDSGFMSTHTNITMNGGAKLENYEVVKINNYTADKKNQPGIQTPGANYKIPGPNFDSP